ncbi:hypothetical protein DPMN_118050 [Dreissena polymorpha]|uniref:Uncharacterized protein n=1 Tax=Dreissena polymorpha TaxID=45954 RepID=A0A9D4GGT8_DREPO|nr:hypothetical protein DPMN_118050 [Dreissena polymorpha]
MGRGKKHRDRQKRKKSSESDSENRSSKQFKYGGPLTSDILGEVHSVLYESYIESYIDSDSDSEYSECEDTVFDHIATVQQPGSKSPTEDADVTNMAGVHSVSLGKISHQPHVMTEKEQLSFLVSTVTMIKEGQDSMKALFEAKLGNLKSELITNINSKVH